MSEILLHANRRVLLLSMVPAAALAATGILLLRTSTTPWIRATSWGLAALGLLLVAGLVNQLRRPRIAYQDGSILFNLRAGAPVAVPAELVEAFFLGQGPAHLPPIDGKPAETVNLVARISEKAPEWARVEVKPALGRWCEGYVTICGTWCEPLNGEVIRRLNRRLREFREAAAPTEDVAVTGAEGERPS